MYVQISNNIIIRFDGGPKCTNNQLQRCEVCYADYIETMLKNRIETETKNFARLGEETSLHVIYNLKNAKKQTYKHRYCAYLKV